MSGEEFPASFRLGDWLVATDTCTLSSADKSVKVTPRSMEVLVYLARNSGRVVNAQELLDHLWTNVTSDHAVHKAIAELRGAVADDASQQSFIKTVRKRGYLLIAEPQFIQSENNSGRNLQALTSGAMQSVANMLRSWQTLAVSAVVALILVALLMMPVSQPSDEPPLLGVLPFQVDAIQGQSNRFLADGVTSSLLGNLSRLNQLRVISLPHDARYSTATRPVTEIGQELGIDHMLEGSLLQSEDRIRVTARLIRVADGVQLYSQQFDLGNQDIFSIQDTIVSNITDSLRIHLDEEQRREMLDWGTTNALAYRHFLQGEYYNNQFNPGDFRLAIEHHRSAVELDPDFENAYLGIATAANNLAVYSRMSQIDELRSLVAEVHRQVGTRNASSEILDSIQAIEARMGGINHREQEQDLREEILSGSPPDYAMAHYALFLIGARMFSEAEQFLARAAEVNPYELSPDEIWSYRADIVTPSEEVMIRKRQLQERPNHIGMLGTVGRNLALEGRLEEASDYIERLRELDTEQLTWHLTHVVVGVLTGELRLDSEAVAQEYQRGPNFFFNNGVLAFMLGDIERGKQFWTALAPVQKRRLRNLVYAVEKFFPQQVTASSDYKSLLEQLDVGKSWQFQLMRGIQEMEQVTGVSLSPQAQRALDEDTLMGLNNRWPESVWEDLRKRLPVAPLTY